jgi:hypothetical protein
MKKLIFLVLVVSNISAFAQLPLKGDTIIYTKINKTVKEILPKAINFITNKSTSNDVLKVYPKAKLTKQNEDKVFSILVKDEKNIKLNYIFAGNTSDNKIEITRVSCNETEFAIIFSQIGNKTVADKGVDYWFLQTKDNSKVYIMINKMGNNYVVGVGVKPLTWVHLLKK